VVAHASSYHEKYMYMYANNLDAYTYLIAIQVADSTLSCCLQLDWVYGVLCGLIDQKTGNTFNVLNIVCLTDGLKGHMLILKVAFFPGYGKDSV